MARTAINICNEALAMIGTEPINAFTDEGKEAALCNLLYPSARDEVLTLYPWSCTIARADLQRLSETPVSGYEYAYAMPNDYLAGGIVETPETMLPFEIEGGKLLTNAIEITIKYQKQVTDPNKFSPLLASVIATRLAQMISMPITQSTKISSLIDSKFELVLLRAKGADAAGASQEPGVEPRWVDAQSVYDPLDYEEDE